MTILNPKRVKQLANKVDDDCNGYSAPEVLAALGGVMVSSIRQSVAPQNRPMVIKAMMETILKDAMRG